MAKKKFPSYFSVMWGPATWCPNFKFSTHRKRRSLDMNYTSLPAGWTPLPIFTCNRQVPLFQTRSLVGKFLEIVHAITSRTASKNVALFVHFTALQLFWLMHWWRHATVLAVLIYACSSTMHLIYPNYVGFFLKPFSAGFSPIFQPSFALLFFSFQPPV